jgi:hypothetical protein
LSRLPVTQQQQQIQPKREDKNEWAASVRGLYLRPASLLQCGFAQEIGIALTFGDLDELRRANAHLRKEDCHARGPLWKQLNRTAQRASQIGGFVLE